MSAKRSSVAERLLGWWDRHRRDLPWRTPPGRVPDPYRVWLSEIMLQQTTVATVRPRFVAWVARWPDLASLAAADEREVMAAWAGLGYYARARNLVRAARALVAEHGGALPISEAALRRLPGFGAYTAAAVAAIAFDVRAVVVDANVERVVARLFAIAEPLPGARRPIRAGADRLTPAARPGDFAQAMMDLGATVCTPRRPRCLLCPLSDDCAGFASGIPDAFPVRPAKRERPVRHGTIFWAEADRRVLLVRRPATGLLGGMAALPTGPWIATSPGLIDPPLAADWQLLGREVDHDFTHFHLRLALAVARVPVQEAGDWWPIDALAAAGLPTLFAHAAHAIIEEMS